MAKRKAPSAFRRRWVPSNFIISVILTAAKMIFFIVLLLALSGTGLIVGVAKAWIDTAPAIDLSLFNAQAQTSFIYDANGRQIASFKGTENRIYCTYDELPQYLIDAVVAVEDARFFTHYGIDIKRYAGSLVSNLLHGTNEGGSTITCQLVKQTILGSEQTYKRKVQEAYLALELEDTLTQFFDGDRTAAKRRILEEYLNVIFLGGSIYGVKTAAMDYFGKDVSELSLRECAMLAYMIKSPNRYNPRRCYYTTNTPQLCEDGADYALELMWEKAYITEAEYRKALGERLTVLKTSPTASDSMYDHAYYVEYAIYDVVTKMLRVEGLDDTSANRSQMETKLRTGGYHIYTSLRPDMQQAVQTVATEWTQYPSMRYTSDQIYKASSNGGYIDVVQPQVAIAVMDWHTGELAAIVGGRTEPTAKRLLNRAYQMKMPVGSSIKPLSVYGPAFDMGWSPGTPVLNLPIPIENWDSETGYPTNYGGGGWNGCESMRLAMSQSHNYSSAQALFQYVGITNSVNYLLKLGVSMDHISATGSGLALGSSGISVIEMAAAFGAIANQGRYQESYAFTEVRYSDNETAYIDVRDVQIKRQAFKESTAYMLVDVLTDCVNGTYGTGSRAKFGHFTVAGKTGTNSDACGVFFAGMTAYYSCAVWIGHEAYKPLIASATGGSYAAPLWSAVMQRVHSVAGITRDAPILQGVSSDYGLVRAEACGVSGLRPTEACRIDASGYGVTNDYYLEGTQPTVACNMHRSVTLCTRSNRRPNGHCTSVRTYGVIYIPAGHPLRQATTLPEVQVYFKGASVNKDTSSFGTCTICG